MPLVALWSPGIFRRQFPLESFAEGADVLRDRRQSIAPAIFPANTGGKTPQSSDAGMGTCEGRAWT